MGNPGIAKTTGVRLWAEINGYRVTTLIGTQRVAEEILGYMVNDTGEKRLITYTPDWYDEIQDNKKAGFKTLLFVDELSQAPDNVQGAMLQLIFDRRVGGRANYLPEDCLVVSAANYKGNIPPQCGIQAPTLNRFCIVNIKPLDGVGLVEEFLQSEDEIRANLPLFSKTEASPSIVESVRRNLKNALTIMFSQFSDKDRGILNINNTEFSDIFDQPGLIHNFITGRTVHYLNKIILACICSGLIRKNHKRVVGEFSLGLIGLGTNSFATDSSGEEAKRNFQRYVRKTIQAVLRKSCEENMNEINATEIKFKGKTVEKCISDWMLYNESSGNLNDINMVRLIQIIETAFPVTTEGMEQLMNNWDNKQNLADLNKIDQFLNFLKKVDVLEVKNLAKRIELVSNTYEAYKIAMLNNIVK